MHGLWNFFLEKKQFTLLLIAGLVLWGTVAVSAITKESAPEVQIPVGIVSTVLPGASAEDVERLVTNKIEEKLANLSDLNTLTSTSREGVSIITAEFNASANLEKSIQKLRDEVEKAKPDLPADATDPTVSEVNFVDQPVQIISISTDAPFGQLAVLGESLKSELQGVPGVSRVEVSGVRDREIRVVTRKEDLARYGITLSQVVGAIASANASLPVGAITTNDVAYNVAFEGDLNDVRDLEGLPILNVANRVIYLRDIAEVWDGVEKTVSLTRISENGAPSAQALTLSIFKIRGEDVTTVTAGVRARLDALKETPLLSGSTVVITNDAGEEVQKDLTQLTRTALETIALVMVCLFATIGWRESIIAGLSIPLSFLIAFIGLLYSGNTLNFVSLFSLILAIGILVDSGIVIVEAIHTRLRLFGDGPTAAKEAIREYAWPLIGGTVATIVFFVPLFFISGVVGKFIATIPFTIIFVLLASVVVALGMVPLLTIMFAAKPSEHTWLMDKQEEYAAYARAWYAHMLRAVLLDRGTQNRFLAAIGIMFVLSFALPVVGAVKVNFFPQGDIDFLYVDIETPPGTTLARTDLATRAVEEALYGVSGIESMVVSIGGTSAFGNNPQSDARYANITINLPSEREETSSEVLERVQEALRPLTVADIRTGQPSGGPPVGAAIVIKFLGTDRAALDAAVELARTTLESTPGATNVNTSSKDDGAEFVLHIDRAKLAALNVSPSTVAATLRTAVSGTTATKLTGGAKDVEVVVSTNLNPAFTDPHRAADTTMDALRQLPVPTQNGQAVLLGSLVSEGIRRSNAAIRHEDRQRVVSVSADVTEGSTVAEVLAAFEVALAQSELPTGVTKKIGGENEETNRSFAEMGYGLLAGIALSFVVLVLAFDSYRFSAFLLLTVPLSLIGVMFGLAFTGQALSFPSLLGVIALSGVIINHAIILVDAILVRLREGTGRTLLDIVVESATSRLRPIFLTTITTVVGMLPLTHASDLWSPLAYAILFGLSFAMVLTLVFIPILVFRWPGPTLKARMLPDGTLR